VKVAGLWEFGWSAPLTECSFWKFPLQDFGIDEWDMCPITGINEPAVTEYPELSDVIAANPDLTVIFVDENGQNTLNDFVHPPKALYIFGKASQSAFATYFREGDLSLKIETVQNQGLLWPHQAAILVLYDRMLKMR